MICSVEEVADRFADVEGWRVEVLFGEAVENPAGGMTAAYSVSSSNAVTLVADASVATH